MVLAAGRVESGERLLAASVETEVAPHGEGNVYAPDVVTSGGRRLMFYGGQGRDGHDRIHAAVEGKDGKWEKRGVVFDPPGLNHVNDPSVVVVGGEWYLFYTRAAVGVTDTIGLATSRDGMKWEDAGTVLGPSAAPAWDALLVGRPSVCYEDGVFRMWYDGRKDLPVGAPDAAAPKSANSRRWVGYATSRDGRVWKKHGEPVFGEDACGLLLPKGNGAADASGHVTPFLEWRGGKAALYFGAAAAATWDRNDIWRETVGAERLRVGKPAEKD
jgi:hypothetical protein